MTREEQIRIYHSLLVSDWNEDTLTRSICLLRTFDDIISETIFYQVQATLPSVVGPEGFDESIALLCETLIGGCIVVRLDHDYLLRDVVSLVASQAVELLHEPSHKGLDRVLMTVALLIFDDAPARRHSLEGSIYMAWGRNVDALRAWDRALVETNPCDPDYLARFETLYDALRDAHLDDEAARLLASLPSHLAEQFANR